MYRQVGWIDTFLPLTVPFWFAAGGGAFTIFLMRQFFLALPYLATIAALLLRVGATRSPAKLAEPYTR